VTKVTKRFSTGKAFILFCRKISLIRDDISPNVSNS